MALVSGLICSLQAYLMLVLCYRFVGPSLIFYRRTLFYRFILLASGITLLACGVAWMSYQGCMHCSPSTSFLNDWLANLSGIFMLTLPLLALDAYFPDIKQLQKFNKKIRVMGLLFLMLLSLAVFSSHDIVKCVAISLLFFTSFAIAKKYGWPGANTVSFVIGFLFCGPALLSVASEPGVSNLSIQIVYLGASLLGLLVSVRSPRISEGGLEGL